MTRINIYRRGGSCIGINISGHSGYDEEGKDIICAAISSLSINFVNSVEKLTDDTYDLSTDESRGYIDFVFNSKISPESRVLLDSLILGVKSLSEENKEYVSYQYKEV